MTYAEQLRAEGEAQKQVEIVDGFLRVGVTWDVIEAATGLTKASFQELKGQVAKPDPQSTHRSSIDTTNYREAAP